MFLYLIRAVILLGSLLGYVLWLRQKGLEISFTPVLAVSGISLVMFFAGLLNLLPYAVPALFFGGYLCLVLCLIDKKSPPPAKTLAILLPFSLFFLFLAVRLYRTEFFWFDNFSHWAVIVRDMLKTHQLPNFSSPMVIFKEYPPATACFLYYVCRIVGTSSGCMLFGQSILLLSCLCVLWAFVKKLQLLPIALAALGSVYLLIANIPISELCVDSLLSFYGLASFAFLVYYYPVNRRTALMGNSVILTCLTMIKTSGLFFVLLHTLLTVIFEFRDARAQQRRVSVRALSAILGFTALIPLLAFFLWDRHVAYSFPASDFLNQGTETAYYLDVVAQKGWHAMLAVVRAFLERQLHPAEEFFPLLAALGTMPVCAAAKHFLTKQPIGREVRFFSWAAFTHVCYLAGMLGMYLFSMPYWDASYVDSYVRYLYTSTVYIFGTLIVYFLLELQGSASWKRAANWIGPVVFCLVIAALPRSPISLLTGDVINEDQLYLREMKTQYAIPDSAACYILGEKGNGRLRLTARYELWSDDCEVGSGPEEGSFPQFLQEYDYLIVMDGFAPADSLLKEAGMAPGQQVYDLADYR